jgi:hypothetical protein
MASVQKKNGSLSVTAYRGDAKTLLAFNLPKAASKNLAGFTLQCTPDGQAPFYIHNNLQFKDPSSHAQDAKEPATSSINAPIHKFRWVHVPGTVHQGIKPFLGKYVYTVTPRYFDANASLQALDPTRSVSVTIQVDVFAKKGLELGFTRGYTQSQAFVHHFGLKALIRPNDDELQFDTSQESGVNAAGEHFKYADEYEWLGFTAREKIFALLNEVLQDKSLRLDVFAYDLNEPDFIGILLKLGKQKRVRVILDNAALHHTGTAKKKTAASTKAKKPAGPTPEDQFEKLFVAAAGKTRIKRGKFGRYAHDKVLIVRNAKTSAGNPGGTARKVLTGSTNFSVTGLYVNSNHVLVFNDPAVAAAYASVFDEVWDEDVNRGEFVKGKWAQKPFTFSSAQTPKTVITFSPHDPVYAKSLTQQLVARIQVEEKKRGNVLFAVMQIDGPAKGKKAPTTGAAVKKTENAVYSELNNLHSNQNIFSYGISDKPAGIALFPLGKKTGVLVTGKPVNTQLPAPFNQVRNIGGVGHQVHHKFVVCGFNGPDPVVYCGSSNLAEGGETQNGDNLLAIYDEDVVTVFTIEALTLVDHFNFLDRTATGPKKNKAPQASKQQAAIDAHWYLSTDGKWAEKFFDPNDLHSVDRTLFGG